MVKKLLIIKFMGKLLKQKERKMFKEIINFS